MHLDAALGHAVRRHRLDPEVDRRHREALATLRGHDVRLGRGHLVHQRGARHRRRGEHARQQRGWIALGGGYADPHGTSFADVPGESPGVHTGDPDHAVGLQSVVKAALRTPVGGHPGGVTYDVAGDPDPA